jgi:hypothetical protein
MTKNKILKRKLDIAMQTFRELLEEDDGIRVNLAAFILIDDALWRIADVEDNAKRTKGD